MGEKILIVDDDASFRRVVDYTLKEEGYQTALADDALSALNKLDFSLVITDVRMPHMTGLEFLKKIQAKTPDTACRHRDGSRRRGRCGSSHAGRGFRLRRQACQPRTFEGRGSKGAGCPGAQAPYAEVRHPQGGDAQRSVEFSEGINKSHV
jgi:hypothetical protein